MFEDYESCIQDYKNQCDRLEKRLEEVQKTLKSELAHLNEIQGQIEESEIRLRFSLCKENLIEELISQNQKILEEIRDLRQNNKRLQEELTGSVIIKNLRRLFGKQR